MTIAYKHHAAAHAVAAGTPYSAHDPALLMWVHATLVHKNLRVYELFVDRLAPDDRDRYCAESARRVQWGGQTAMGEQPCSSSSDFRVPGCVGFKHGVHDAE
jgi:uncharacterized protein (DUF2236 family)